MSHIVETDAGFFVVTNHDGRKIAGPFKEKAQSYQAQAETPPLVIYRASHRNGFFVGNEETGARVSDFYKSEDDAIRERERLCPTVKKWGDVAYSPSPALQAKKTRGRPPVPEAA